MTDKFEEGYEIEREKRNKRIAERNKNNPEKEDIQEKQFDNLEEIKEKLAKQEPIKEDKIKMMMRDSEDLRNVFVAVVLNPVSRYGELKLEDEKTGKFISRHEQAYRMLRKLREIELIKSILVNDVWEKKLKSEKLTKEEKIVLKKWKEWIKTMTDKQMRMYKAKTNYYVPTEKGLNKGLLNFIINARNE